MVFSSAVFLWLFLPIVFVVNYVLPTKLSNIWLLLASLVFYAWGEPFFVFLMIASIVLNWLAGLAIAKSRSHKRVFLTIGIALNLGLLGYYKYANFVVEILNSLSRRELFADPGIKLPIGISFFTFQAISYIIDVCRGETEASRSPINTALYISFFPQLIAGPIVKYKDINQQIANRHICTDCVADGFRRFCYGLAKKVLLSNQLGLAADSIFALDIRSLGGITAWIGALTYTFQIYYDFSGYSDMAIGLGKMFGFHIPENFQYPYISRSIREFWRRWHISLGSWFREYVYIPLGGNRKGAARMYLNLCIVFLLTGLWHGANYTFLVWGIYHGFFSILERGKFGGWLKKHCVLSHIYTGFVVMVGWVLFRSETLLNAARFLKRMFLPWRYSAGALSVWRYMDHHALCALILAILGMGFLQEHLAVPLLKKWKFSVPDVLYCGLLLVLCLASVASNTYNPFIYFQF